MNKYSYEYISIYIYIYFPSCTSRSAPNMRYGGEIQEYTNS